MIRVILTDIEGTTTPLDFVHAVLFPRARAALPALLRRAEDDGEVAAAVRAVRAEAPGADPLATLLGWMDEDRKATALKQLQGIAWREAYASGDVRGALYPDVPAALRRWHGLGVRLAVYSSGSEEAQRLLFRHSEAGDLEACFEAFFDTRVGDKMEPGSYASIARALRADPAAVLFLSDREAELDAAAGAGLGCCQACRSRDGTVPSLRHPRVADFVEVDRLLGTAAGDVGA